MTLLRVIGVLFIIAWLVLWLALKITFVAIHLLLAIGVVVLIVSVFSAARSRS